MVNKVIVTCITIIALVGIILAINFSSSPANYKDVIKELKSMGYKIERKEIIIYDRVVKTQHMTCALMLYPNQVIVIREFENPDIAESEEKTILNAYAQAELVGEPYLYRKDNMLIFYVHSHSSKNEQILKDFEKLFGMPSTNFLGHGH